MKVAKKGKLTVIAGPMYSGKTGKLIAVEETLKCLGFKLIVFKPNIDNRYSSQSELFSHDFKKTGANLISIDLSPKETEEIIKSSADVIIFDEVQFFNKQKILKIIKKLLSLGKNIICAGLLYDYQRKPFGATPDLVGLSDEQMELKAICVKCGSLASHTERLGGTNSLIDVGAVEKYIAVCQKCHKIYKSSRKI